MQTFLPYPSFRRSAAVLDARRLGKQRVEVLQILRALHFEGYGWAHHPAVLMWRGHTRALVAYGIAVVDEWRDRGHADRTRPNITEFTRPEPALTASELPGEEFPPWLGWSALHRSHRAALLRKDPNFYGAAFPDTPPDVPSVWPESPAGPPPEQPFAAWVVRPPNPEVLAAFCEHTFVGVPLCFGAPAGTPKQRRQLLRLRDVARSGERVVVPEGSELRCGVLAGPPVERAVAGDAFLTRDVVWGRAVSRSALRRPYQLRDPQAMFALRGENAVVSPAAGR